MAPLVAAIRCSASIDADASTTKTIRLPTLRSRTFCRRSSRSSFSRSPGRRPRSFCIGAAARTVASMAWSFTFAFGSARTRRPRLLFACWGRAVLAPVAPDRLPRAVSERVRGGVVDVLAARRRVPAIRGQRPGGVVDHDVGAVAEHVRLDADRRDEAGLSWSDTNLLHSRDRLCQSAR